MGGSSQKTETSGTSVAKPPKWFEDAAIKSLQVADRINQIGYVPYMGNEIAAFTPMQQSAMQSSSDWMSASNGTQRKDAMAGMPEAKRDASGVKGYSSAEGFMNNLETLRKRFPDQYSMLTQFGGDLLSNPSQPAGGVENSPWNVGNTAAASAAASRAAAAAGAFDGSKGQSSLTPFGPQQMPGNGGHDPMMDFLYSAGVPGLWTKANGSFQQPNVYEDQYMQAIRAGKDPSTVMPWGQKPQAPAPKPVKPTKPNYNNPNKWW
jgi:cell division septation protein DedD